MSPDDMRFLAELPPAPTVERTAEDGSLIIEFADPEDPRLPGGGTLVLSAEVLRHFAQSDPAFPWETFPEV
ncbi:hypothetical protein [Streptomyces sp. G1]|uniref:hypothetical protein n=1 Tax=Streptomyces sp. G1 TaxID=361572 RepID=UPI00202FD4E6|nr:hypothetical protein [Streptomyces sp. G1]MCM1964849.1 hypothetical protein [Streptomyces sp. G1]